MNAQKEWPKRRLDELTEPARPITYGVVKPGDHDDLNGVRFIRGGDIAEGKINISNLRTITSEVSAGYKRTLLRGGEVVVSLVGNPGEAAVVPASLAGANIARQTGLVALRDDVDSRYVMYFLRSPGGRAELFAQTTGSVQQVINLANLKNIRVPLPDLTTQRKIAGILSTYDDLIENNLRRIKILEQMAQSLYREWFVHFRFPGHESAQLSESPLGRVPKGWASLFGEHVDYKEGPGLRKWQYRKEGIPFLNIRTLGDNDIDLTSAQYLDPVEVETKYQHFLLDKFDHVVSSSGTIGRVVTVREAHLPLMLNTSIIRMRPNGSRVGLWQLKHFLISEGFQNQAIAFATGAAQPNFGPSHLKQMTIIAPPESLSKAYERLATPLEEAIHSLIATSQNLRRTRDLLLPKLLQNDSYLNL